MCPNTKFWSRNHWPKRAEIGKFPIVIPVAPCHRPIGKTSYISGSLKMKELNQLFSDIEAVSRGTKGSAKTEKLLREGQLKIAKKVGEEGVEVAVAAMLEKGRKNEIIGESADLLFNLLVLWIHAGVSPDEVDNELARRRKAFGIAEKPGKGRKV